MDTANVAAYPASFFEQMPALTSVSLAEQLATTLTIEANAFQTLTQLLHL
jgi:hypothetical protein